MKEKTSAKIYWPESVLMHKKGMDPLKDIKTQLQETLNECARLLKENDRLKKLIGRASEETLSSPKLPLSESSIPYSSSATKVNNNSTPEAKVALFRSLFRGREDVYPVRWERKDGRSGYSPACGFEWKRPLCGKPRVKCADCENRKLLPVIDEVIQNHLIGKHIIGVYPLLSDETCWFLAVDFDKKTWQEDAAAFLTTCNQLGISASLERSRSGKGGHVWIFFTGPVSASQARKLGCAILTRTLDKRHQVGLDSYDRFFPNQDTLPKGGFGNLIALPLQWAPREKGNSVFLNPEGFPYSDQWEFLSNLEKLSFEKLEAILQKDSKSGQIINIRMSFADETADEDPWTLPPSQKKNEKPVSGPLPQSVRLVQGNLIYIEKKELPPALISRLIRLAAFQNPEFYRAQALRLPTYDKPRIICCAEDFPEYIGLPRGCLDEILALFETHGVRSQLIDERYKGQGIKAQFVGKLRPDQEKIASTLIPYDHGVLSAPTAFGKTVLAAWFIAARGVNTLVLVHRQQLLDQWRDRLAFFLDLTIKEIGQIGGGKDQPSGMIDVGILQSLNRKGKVKDIVAVYGQIIVDECHHIPAFSFEQVLKKAKAQYVLGLTATPIRKDGHHPIVLMQCGPIRFKENPQKAAKIQPFEHVVFPRKTNFRLQEMFIKTTVQDIYSALIKDQDRNDLIFDDLLSALEAGRSPLLLTERTEHLNYFASRLERFARNVIVLKGGLGKRQRQIISDQLKSIPGEEERVIISTGRYIGEGFDDARLDTLFLVMPISWRGTLEQYVGRLHRTYENKKVVQVYDYLDTNVPMLVRMYQKRLKGYKAIGYVMEK
jgi:superfamily II DNA or RNA helicase